MISLLHTESFSTLKSDKITSNSTMTSDRYNSITLASQATYKTQLTKVKTKAEPDPVYLVAIVVNDNDYYSTFYNLLETVLRVLKWKPKAPKEHIEYLIKQSIKFHYLAFQATEESNLEAKESYLLKKVQILFNEEAQKDIETKDHDHGAWYLVTHSSLINSY